MSVQCPHCGGEFNLEVKLTANGITSCTPKAVQPITADMIQQPKSCTPEAVQPITADMIQQPKFAVHTDAGKLRRAIYQAGYTNTAKTGTIFNDKRGFGRRLKMWTRLGRSLTDSQCVILETIIAAEFGNRTLRVYISGGEILVYLNS